MGIAESPHGQARARRVLLAEDNVVNQQIALTLLTRAGYLVDTVANGADALSAVSRDDYDLVLMDVEMPDVDGLEATRRIRALDGPKARIPIVALTADVDAGAREKYLAAGMDDYVCKPLEPSLFLALVGGWSGAAASAIDALSRARIATTGPGTDGFDDAVLGKLAAALSVRELETLVTTYLTGARDLMTRIEDDAQRGDLAALAAAAHELKSTSGNFGAREVQGLAARLETACKTLDRPAVADVVQQLRPASEHVWAMIRRRFGQA
jgi:CheY-like chemotaxis protein